MKERLAEGCLEVLNICADTITDYPPAYGTNAKAAVSVLFQKYIHSWIWEPLEWIIVLRGGAFVRVRVCVCMAGGEGRERVLDSRQACLSKQNKRWPVTVPSFSEQQSSLHFHCARCSQPFHRWRGWPPWQPSPILLLLPTVFQPYLCSLISPWYSHLHVPSCIRPSLAGSLRPSGRYWFR